MGNQKLYLCCISIMVPCIFLNRKIVASSWEDWWTYEGFSGADYWGLVNPEWTFCSKGKYQSPVDINLNNLLYDPNLAPLKYIAKDMELVLQNDGHHIKLLPSNQSITPSATQIWSGPLLYRYTFSDMILHYGSNDDQGSEHTLNGQSYPAELQLYFYNSDLYANYSQAINSIHGIAGIVLLLKILNETSPDIQDMYGSVEKLEFKGSKISIEKYNLGKLLQNLGEYITYQGSLTYPHCQESVVWLIMNKPLFISASLMKSFRKLKRSLEGEPKILLENNFRSTLPSNGRSFLTNIKYQPDDKCEPITTTPSYKLNT